MLWCARWGLAKSCRTHQACACCAGLFGPHGDACNRDEVCMRIYTSCGARRKRARRGGRGNCSAAWPGRRQRWVLGEKGGGTTVQCRDHKMRAPDSKFGGALEPCSLCIVFPWCDGWQPGAGSAAVPSCCCCCCSCRPALAQPSGPHVGWGPQLLALRGVAVGVRAPGCSRGLAGGTHGVQRRAVLEPVDLQGRGVTHWWDWQSRWARQHA